VRLRPELAAKMNTPSQIPFDPREGRAVSDLARWMGLLGRFQIVAAVFVFILLLAAAALVTTAEVLEPASGAESGEAAEEPLVKIGEVSRGAIAITVLIVVAFSLLFLRGGMLLISAAEDLELVAVNEGGRKSHLDGALRRLRSYFVLESILMAGVAAAVYAATILQWPGM
jgi:hypothetical protein